MANLKKVPRVCIVVAIMLGGCHRAKYPTWDPPARINVACCWLNGSEPLPVRLNGRLSEIGNEYWHFIDCENQRHIDGDPHPDMCVRSLPGPQPLP